MSETTDVTTDAEQPDELSRIPATRKRFITLAATVEVADLPVPARNYLADQARQIERQFTHAVGAGEDQVGETHTVNWPPEREKVCPEVVVDVSDATDARRVGVFTAARAHERRFMDAVESVRRKYGD